MAEHEAQAELDPLVASVAEGEAVDWDAAESTATESRSRRLRALKALARLSALNESLQAGEDAILSSDLPPRSVVAETAEVAIGRWGHLELLERVGAGASAEVFRARDTQLDREVAVKLLRGSLGSASKALQEGRLLARVRHPNVATVYGADERDGQVGVWMEFVRGKTLHRLVEEQGPMAAKEAALVGVELCRALAAVHAQGVVHRDIKAQNAMRAEGGRILLVDFGIGIDLAAESAGAASVSGTPVYLAPEVFAGGAATFLSDLYSLGVLMFFLVTGKFPVTSETIGALREKHRKGERGLLRDLRPDLPSEFVRVVEKASSPEPSTRYGTAGALEQALAELLGGVEGLGTGVVKREGRFKAGWGRWKRRVAWAALGALVLGVVLGLFQREALTREYFLWKADRLHEQGERDLEIGALHDGLKALPLEPHLLHRLSDAFAGAGRYTEALAASGEAFANRFRVGELDQLRIAASYFKDRLDYAEARKALAEVARKDQSDDNALRDLAMLEMMLRNLPQAVNTANLAVEINPNDVINYGTLSVLEAVSGHETEALNAARRGREKKGDHPYLSWGEGLALAMQGSYEDARRAFRKMTEGEHIYNTFGTLMGAQVQILEGDLLGARNSLETALEKDRHLGSEGAQAIRRAWLIKLAMLRGQEDEARRRLRQLEEVPKTPIFLKSLRAAALGYAELNDVAASLRVLESIRDLQAGHPTSVGGGFIAHIEGELARASGDHARALERIAAAREQWGWGDPETLYSLVRALREAGRCNEALVEVDRLQKLKGFILKEHISTLWVLSYVEQARCHSALGNTVAARDSYRAFLELWGDNAADLPIVREVEKELGQLPSQ